MPCSTSVWLAKSRVLLSIDVSTDFPFSITSVMIARPDPNSPRPRRSAHAGDLDLHFVIGGLTAKHYDARLAPATASRTSDATWFSVSRPARREQRHADLAEEAEADLLARAAGFEYLGGRKRRCRVRSFVPDQAGRVASAINVRADVFGSSISFSKRIFVSPICISPPE